MIFLDTHVVVWMYAGLVERFSPVCSDALEEHDLVVSPMVMLELQYLHETGRLTADAHTVLAVLTKTVGLQVSELAFNNVILDALAQGWTRDPFDRIIVAQAAVEGIPLLTKDETIRKHYRYAFWDKAPVIPGGAPVRGKRKSRMKKECGRGAPRRDLNGEASG